MQLNIFFVFIKTSKVNSVLMFYILYKCVNLSMYVPLLCKVIVWWVWLSCLIFWFYNSNVPFIINNTMTVGKIGKAYCDKNFFLLSIDGTFWLIKWAKTWCFDCRSSSFFFRFKNSSLSKFSPIFSTHFLLNIGSLFWKVNKTKLL